jgi:probable F420-dependent oxidoreductase
MTDAPALPPVPPPPLGRIGVWSADFYSMTRDEAAAAAAELDRLGYGAIWLPEFLVRDPFVTAALVLAGAPRLTVATGIANIWARDPAAMTSAAVTLNAAFGGRFLLGLGISHAPLVDAILGEVYAKPLARMTRYLRDIDETGDRMAAMGRPVAPQPRVIAALGPKMLELARDASAGAHPYLVTPEHTAQARQVLGQGPLLAPEQAVVLSPDPAVVRARGRDHLQGYLRLPNYTNNWKRLGFTDADLEDGGSDRLIEAMVAGGSPERIRERIEAHLNAGADHVCIQVLNGDPAAVRADWRRLAPVLLG